ncbi:hypothetical protein [Rhodohalobacter sp. 8-1]|uniref:hypothetical protein n=1 Tax=Rhodohalobacter sp. 8-1 TaxID=3131972 RepID=UPI0030EB6310
MQIFSNPNRDVSTPKPTPGSYEWWYFDAISIDNQYSLVIIFYEGNPFSRRYIDAIQDGQNDRADDYPAISISIYKEDEPIFYSFEEVMPGNAEFSSDTPFGRVKGNSFKQVPSENGALAYRLNLDQIIPNGDRLVGNLRFESSDKGPFSDVTKNDDQNNESLHKWNLVQARASVNGQLSIEGLHPETIKIAGTGYHDHNTGMEPMKESFVDWYWGRVHFNGSTLIYYLMNEEKGVDNRAWLIDSNNLVTEMNGECELSDVGLNMFGLKSARKIEMNAVDDSFLIQQEKTLDDGPFYQRFRSRMMLNLNGELHQAKGISEYICPGRIHMKLFRPLVNMRIQYPGKVHWVQKSPRLYRWTW